MRERERYLTYKCNNAKNSKRSKSEGKGRSGLGETMQARIFNISKSFSFPHTHAPYARAGVSHLHVHLKHPKVLNMVFPSHDLEELCHSPKNRSPQDMRNGEKRREGRKKRSCSLMMYTDSRGRESIVGLHPYGRING